MSTIQQNLAAIKSSLPEHITLVAVSKTKPVSALMEAYDAGQRIFGENRIQEMTEKAALMPDDVQWHMIGHVQSNKVKYMAPFVALVHGVDSIKLLEEIDRQAAKNKRVIDCLLQVHIAKEESKFGFDFKELDAAMTQIKAGTFPHVRIRGLMGMATFTTDEKQIRAEFDSLKVCFDKFRNIDTGFTLLSMGMSGDYRIAIEAGSNMVRIGSSIFGNR